MRFGSPEALNALRLRRNAFDPGAILLRAPSGQASEIAYTFPGNLPPGRGKWTFTVSSTGDMVHEQHPNIGLSLALRSGMP